MGAGPGLDTLRGESMKADLAILIGLIALFVAAFLLCGQRDMALEAQNARIQALENKIASQAIPHIVIEGRASVYALPGNVLVDGDRE